MKEYFDRFALVCSLSDFSPEKMTGRNRRLYYEWNRLEEVLSKRQDISYVVCKRNAQGLPVGYWVTYRILSPCGVEKMDSLDDPSVENPPVFASEFFMQIDLPANYPCVDGAPSFRFLTEKADGTPLSHPWHPNIRYFGEFAGRVCINAMDTHVDLAWCVERIALYLRYELYHALPESPYPEDMTVAKWVIKQGEPHDWVYFDQE